jgi:transposase
MTERVQATHFKYPDSDIICEVDKGIENEFQAFRERDCRGTKIMIQDAVIQRMERSTLVSVEVIDLNL